MAFAAEQRPCLREARFPQRRIYRHCYDGSASQAAHWLAKFPDMMFGLSPKVMKSCHPETRGVFCQLPVGRILMETDAGAMTVPGRQRRATSTPHNVADVYRWYAAAKGLTVRELSYPIKDNFTKFFSDGPRV